jgi:hypothetical protein
MFAKHPKIAEEFAGSMSGDSMKHLPDHVSDLGKPVRPLRPASDVNVKKNVEGSKMDIDKFVRSGVLEQLIEELQQMDFSKKLAPKMGAAEGSPEDVETEAESPEEDAGEGCDHCGVKEGKCPMCAKGEPCDGKEVCPQCSSGAESASEGPEEMDPRLAKIVSAKKGE